MDADAASMASPSPAHGSAPKGGLGPAPSPGPPGLRALARRLEGLGWSAARVEAPGGMRALIVDRGGPTRAAVVPVAGADPERMGPAVAALRALAPSRPLRVLGWGPEPDVPARRRLRRAGVELALFEPLADRDLRFQINRALAKGSGPPRTAQRAPVPWELAARSGLRRIAAPVYTLSAGGVFLATRRPLRPGRRLALELPLGPLLSPRARGRVVLANPAEAPVHPTLPAGMAIRFEALDGPSAAAIDRFVERRLAELSL